MARWFIGDIHGEYGKLVKLVNHVEELDSDAYFIFLGDYIDRGQYSYEVLNYLWDLCNLEERAMSLWA